MMITSASTSRREQSRRSGSAALGIDIGTTSIKMARVNMTGGRWTISNRLVLPVRDKRTKYSPDDGFRGLADELNILRSRTLATRHDCSCVLPMSLTDIRSVEVPDGADSDVHQMAVEALKDCYPDFDQRVTKSWRHSETPHDMAMVSAVSVRTGIAEQIVADLDGVHLKCVSMNSLPFMLARAAEMSHAVNDHQPVGLLDWGHSSVTFVVARQGRPEFVRSFRDCSGGSAVCSLSEGLQLDEDDIRHVLATCGLPSTGTSPDAHGISQSVRQMLMPEIEKVCGELQKTLMYLRHHLRPLLPARLLLFGGMASIPNIADAFQEHCRIETFPWSLNADNSHSTDPIYAVAMAASAGRN